MAKNIVHVLINIIGLGLALAVCIVAFLNYQFDNGFDIVHENGERIFRIEHTQLIEGNPKYFATTPAQLGPALVDDIPALNQWYDLPRT